MFSRLRMLPRVLNYFADCQECLEYRAYNEPGFAFSVFFAAVAGCHTPTTLLESDLNFLAEIFTK